MRKAELSGRQFGRLTVLKEVFPQHLLPCKRLERRWRCLCVCGKSTTVLQCNLVSHRTVSCGCYKREVGVARVNEMRRQWSDP